VSSDPGDYRPSKYDGAAGIKFSVSVVFLKASSLAEKGRLYNFTVFHYNNSVMPNGNSNSLKAVFFDAAGTLFRVRGTVGEVYWRLGQPYGLKTTTDLIEQAFQEQFANAPLLAFPNRTPEEVLAMERRWWEKLMRLVFQEVGMFPRFNDYFNDVFEAFKGAEGWELYPETLKVLEELKSDGRRIGIISNFDSRIHDVCRALEIAPYLDSITISSQTGWAKPSPEIFAQALSLHGLKADEAAYVGDEIEDDVQGALAAGLRPVFLDRSDRAQAPPGVSKIHRLDELWEALSR
jgi:putative hydrolase of the HAD superfamily